MNIYDIAKQAGVSISTVSRVLNGSGYVGKATRERVESVIKDTNFTPSKTAQVLSTSATLRLIGIVCYNIEDLYYAKAVAVLERELRQYGYDILLSCTGESLEQRQNSVDMLISKNIDAIIFIGSVFAGSTEDVIISASHKVPVFIINAKVKGSNIHCAYCDESEAIAHCVRHLYSLQRSKILFLYDVVTYGSAKKLQGYRQGITECNLPGNPDYIVKCAAGVDNGLEAFCKFYAANPVDAVICTNDVTAAGVIAGAHRLNIDVPKSLSIIGYNNSMLALTTCPRMTSLENNVEKLASFTADNLNRYFVSGKAELQHKTDFRLAIRGT